MLMTLLLYYFLSIVIISMFLFACPSGKSVANVKVPYKIAPRRAGDIEQVWADPSYANDVLGWTADTPIDDTMRAAWAWQCRLRDRGIM